MLRIGLSQRADNVPGRDERRDAVDQRWYGLMSKIGGMAVPLPNGAESAETLFDGLHLHAVVLTGGNDVAEAPDAANVAPERDRLERGLIDLCLRRQAPLLGVCRGMQMINVALGGRLTRTQGHAGVRHAINVQDGARWPDGWQVNSYHDVSIPIDGLAPQLHCIARSANGDVEAFSHVEGRCHGIMWHPERETPPRDEDLAFMTDALGL